jgi:uncharacterized protein YlxW (UPF0749 family)
MQDDKKEVFVSSVGFLKRVAFFLLIFIIYTAYCSAQKVYSEVNVQRHGSVTIIEEEKINYPQKISDIEERLNKLENQVKKIIEFLTQKAKESSATKKDITIEEQDLLKFIDWEKGEDVKQ